MKRIISLDISCESYPIGDWFVLEREEHVGVMQCATIGWADLDGAKPQIFREYEFAIEIDVVVNPIETNLVLRRCHDTVWFPANPLRVVPCARANSHADEEEV